MPTTTDQTIIIPADLAARIEALSIKDKNQFAIAAIADAVVEREKRKSSASVVSGPAKPLKHCFDDLQIKLGGPDLSHLTSEELEKFGLKAIAEMNPALRDELFTSGVLSGRECPA